MKTLSQIFSIYSKVDAVRFGMFFILTFFFSAPISAQHKSHPHENAQFRDKLELVSNLPESTEYYRLWMRNQVIELSKNDNENKGSLTTYLIVKPSIYQEKTDTVFSKRSLSHGEVVEAFSILGNIDVNAIRNDNQLAGWNKNAEGNPYIIEFQNLKGQGVKSFYNVQKQKDIREADLMKDVFRSLSKALNLRRAENDFMRRLPKYGNYSDGQSDKNCDCNNAGSIGYRGSTLLPAGFSAGAYFNRIGRNFLSVSANIAYSQNNERDRDLLVSVVKHDLFNKNFSSISRSLNYRYRNRIFTAEPFSDVSHNHKFIYRVSAVKIFTLGAGVDFLSHRRREQGVILTAGLAHRRFGIKTAAVTSIFKSHRDYELSIRKSFRFKSKGIKRGSVGLKYEKFYGFGDYYFSTHITF